MTLKELYNKYQQILKIEDEDKREDELFGLDRELYNYISKKYLEISDYLECIDLYEYLEEDEYKYIKNLIRYCMSDKSIVYELTEHSNVDKIIDEYINKNI